MHIHPTKDRGRFTVMHTNVHAHIHIMDNERPIPE